MSRLIALVVTAAALLALPAWAAAGNITLHPSGFGPHSYAAWKAHQGLSDTKGNDDQALYFQKNTATMTFAAGVAVFKGVAGLPVSALTGLEFWVGTDGHCGAGAPRFNLRVQPTSGPSQLFFIGCAEMVPGATAIAPSGRTFQERRFTFPGPTACCGPIPTTAEVVSLAIVFDEGNDVGRCLGTLGTVSGESCVHLDNILIETSSTAFPTKCWTGAQDNGNNTTANCPGGNQRSALSLGVPLAVEQPTLYEMATAFPEVDPLSWVFYPNVLS